MKNCQSCNAKYTTGWFKRDKGLCENCLASAYFQESNKQNYGIDIAMNYCYVCEKTPPNRKCNNCKDFKHPFSI